MERCAVLQLTGVDAGVGGRDPELRLDEFGDEGDEGGDDGALRRVGQADEDEGHVAEDPHRSFGKICKTTRRKGLVLLKKSSVEK